MCPTASTRPARIRTPRGARSVVGPQDIGNRWFSVGMSGHDRYEETTGHHIFPARTSGSSAARRRVRIPPDRCAGRVLSPAGKDFRKTPETGNALSTTATTVGGLLAICWQPASQQGPRKAFVLVGVTGFEPVASAV